MRLPVQVRSSPAHVAQAAEHSHGKGKVAGSSPAVGSKKNGCMKHFTLEIHLKSFESSLLRRALAHISAVCTKLDVPTSSRVVLPPRTQTFTVLRSPHIDKKSREQFKLSSHKAFVKLSCAPKHASFLCTYLKNTSFLGVQVCFKFVYSTYMRKAGLEPTRTMCSTPSR